MFIQFRMPLFFFISGFLAYNAGKVWTGKNWFSAIKKKLLIQIVPTFIFGTLFTYLVKHYSILTFFTNGYKNEYYGYWFTISLLEMFIIYYTINYLIHKFTLQATSTVGVLVIIALILYTSTITKIPVISDIEHSLFASNTFRYFQFFVFGNIFARYRTFSTKALDNNVFTGSIIILFFLFLTVNILSSNASGVVHPKLFRLICAIIPSQVCGYCGLLIIFAFFRKYQTYLTSTTRLGASLQYIGRRTLDIYLLHYFFIPELPFIGVFFRESPNILLELVCGVIISILITGICLLISNTIRISDLLGHYLFGAKITTHSTKKTEMQSETTE